MDDGTSNPTFGSNVHVENMKMFFQSAKYSFMGNKNRKSKLYSYKQKMSLKTADGTQI